MTVRLYDLYYKTINYDCKVGLCRQLQLRLALVSIVIYNRKVCSKLKCKYNCKLQS
jgi:hypothetical protein